jgi:hypothetical protein
MQAVPSAKEPLHVTSLIGLASLQFCVKGAYFQPGRFAPDMTIVFVKKLDKRHRLGQLCEFVSSIQRFIEGKASAPTNIRRIARETRSA